MDSDSSDNSNYCISCGVNMGDGNPRQYCRKTWCPKEFFEAVPDVDEEEVIITKKRKIEDDIETKVRHIKKLNFSIEQLKKDIKVLKKELETK